MIDLTLIRSKEKITTIWFQKDTFSERYLHFESNQAKTK